MGLFSWLGGGEVHRDSDGNPVDDEGQDIWVPPAQRNRPDRVQAYADAHYSNRQRDRWVDSQPDGAMQGLGSVCNNERSAASNADAVNRDSTPERDRASHRWYTEQNVDKAQESLSRMREKVQETREKRLRNGGEDRL